MHRIMLLAVTFSLLFGGSLAEICTSNSGTKYCSYGCCGTYFYRSCCSFTSTSTTYSTAVNIGAIIGSVVGGIFGLAIFITCIVCCVKACTASGTNGTVMRPANNPQVFVMTTGQTQAYPMGQQPYTYPNPAYPSPGGGMAPPPYTENSPTFGGQGPSSGAAQASAYSGGYPLPTPVPSENNAHK